MKGPLSRRRLLSRAAHWGTFAAAAGVIGAEAYILTRKRPMEALYGSYPRRNSVPALAIANPNADRPNIVLITCDDLGYGDLGCYGGKVIRTQNIDRLASEGMRSADFYACSPICSPSRAGMLTGRYPFRTGMTGNPYPADEDRRQTMLRNFALQTSPLGTSDQHERFVTEGLSAREMTLAAALKQAGYRTAMIGKWHLGDFSRQSRFNPLHFGFDSFFGVPHSNDMRPCPLYRDETQEAPDILGMLDSLTARYAAEAVARIGAMKEGPFFLYLSHTFPHQPFAASSKFAGRSAGGAYGDTVEEIDWSVGEILAALERAGVAERTLVILMSDNGPWFEGSAGDLRGGKGQTYDGGFKVPFIARWPARIKAGSTTSGFFTNLDLFPTLLDFAGLSPPKDRVIDGMSIAATLTGQGRSPRARFFYYHYDRLEAVREGQWKYVRRTNRYVWPIPLDAAPVPRKLSPKQLGSDRAPLLYDLSADPGERYNVLARNPDVAGRLDGLMSEWEAANRENPRGFLS